MTRLDRIVLLAVLGAALLSWLVFRGVGAAVAGGELVIEVAGRPVERLSLAGEGRREIIVRGLLGDTTVEVDGGRARVVSAPCPDKVCVSTGWISRPGQAAVCVPGRVVVRIERAAGAGVDATTR